LSDTNSTNQDSNDSGKQILGVPVPDDLGEMLFKLRDYTPIPLIIIMLMMADAGVLSVSLGMLLIFAGELLRIYSVAFIGSISRTRSDNTGAELIRTGPFAYTRNPLYIGNFLISFGFAVYSGSFIVMILTAALFAFQYHHIIAYEEVLLAGRFGADYDRYRQQVPRWFPSRLPSLDQIEWPGNFSPALRSEKRTLSAIGILMLALLIKSF
jgi:protein-S-isoprenylcysteine O-methyltransferase Ste14